MTGDALIALERTRQIVDEGWTPAHDADHIDSELTWAAISYARHAIDQIKGVTEYEWAQFGRDEPRTWPDEWGGFWNPSDDPIRNLTKAGALIAAEIDRLTRES